MFILAPILLLVQDTATVQKELSAMYSKWDRAILAHDKKTMDSILAPSFTAKVKGSPKPMTKKEFLNGITGSWSIKDAPREQSFTTKINKVMAVKTNFAAYISESIVFKLKDGKTRKVDFSSLDVWQKIGKTWQIVQTEPMDK